MADKTNVRLRDVSNGKVENGVVDSTPVSDKDTDDFDDETGTCSRIQDTCTSFCSPCLVRLHPLPENPSLCQRFLHACRMPLHGNLATYLRFGIVCVQIWVILYTLTHQLALPGGNFFSLLILFVCCVVGGYFISFASLPPLLGMLIVGVMLRNIPGISTIGENIDTKWSSVLKKVALTVILTRAGLGLDVVKLKKLSWAVLRLAFTPCLVEIITGAVVSHYLLGFPWAWSWMLGCILGALSPAVTVPSLVSLQDRRYGTEKGIPTMLLAAGGLDNVLCITGFSVFLGIIFSEGDLALTIIKGPLGALAGVVYGFVMGIALWYIPAKDSANPVFYRSLMLFLSGMIAVFGSSEVGLAGAGPLGCLTTATVASYKWRQRRAPGETDEVSAVMGLAWLIVQHFLFGLIGSAVDIGNIKSSTAGLGIATLAIGLVVRSVASYTVTMGTGFNIRERGFIVMTWLSKATVQAAIGGLALDRVKLSDDPNEEHLRLATDILTIAVLAIIICAPTGATLMAVFGPKFLEKESDNDVQLEVVTHDEKPEVYEEDGAPYDGSLEKPGLDDHDTSHISDTKTGIDLPTQKESEPLAPKVITETVGIVNPCFDEEFTESATSEATNTVNNTVNNTLDYTVNNTDNKAVNNTLDSTVNNTDNKTVNNTLDSTVNNTDSKIVNNTLDSTVNNTDNKTVNNTLDSTVNNTVNNTATNTVNNTANNTVELTGTSDVENEEGTSVDLVTEDTKQADVDDTKTVEEEVKAIYKTVVEVGKPSVSSETDTRSDDVDNNNAKF